MKIIRCDALTQKKRPPFFLFPLFLYIENSSLILPILHPWEASLLASDFIAASSFRPPTTLLRFAFVISSRASSHLSGKFFWFGLLLELMFKSCSCCAILDEIHVLIVFLLLFFVVCALFLLFFPISLSCCMQFVIWVDILLTQSSIVGISRRSTCCESVIDIPRNGEVFRNMMSHRFIPRGCQQ